MKTFLKLLAKRSNENKLTQVAGYLTYHTMFALVPLLMVLLSEVSAFPIFKDLTGDLLSFFVKNTALDPNTHNLLGTYVSQAVDNAKQLSAIGIVSLIAVALLLMFNIDRTLNQIWQNTTPRPLVYSFAIYWLILTLGPILMAASFVITSEVTDLLSQNFPHPFVLSLLKATPFFFSLFIFTLIYLLVPNTQIHWKNALCGGLLASCFFGFGQGLLSWYLTSFSSYHSIYGAMAALPIVLLGLQLSWLAILLGAQFSAVLGEYQRLKQPQETTEDL